MRCCNEMLFETGAMTQDAETVGLLTSVWTSVSVPCCDAQRSLCVFMHIYCQKHFDGLTGIQQLESEPQVILHVNVMIPQTRSHTHISHCHRNCTFNKLTMHRLCLTTSEITLNYIITLDYRANEPITRRRERVRVDDNA